MSPHDIRKYRERWSLSQQQLAERVGVDQATISRIENGARPAGPVAILLEQLLAGPAPEKTEAAA